MAINGGGNIAGRGGFWAEPSRVECLLLLWPELSITTAEIGRRLGCTKNTVISKAHRLGLGVRNPSAIPPPPPRRALIPASGECCYPIGHPGTPDFHYCGEAAARGKSYCETHRALTVISAPKRKTKAEAEADAFRW